MPEDDLPEEIGETTEAPPEGGGVDELDAQLATARADYEAHFGAPAYVPEGGFHPSTRAKHAAILRMSIDENRPQAPEGLCLSLGHPYSAGA